MTPIPHAKADNRNAAPQADVNSIKYPVIGGDSNCPNPNNKVTNPMAVPARSFAIKSLMAAMTIDGKAHKVMP